MADQKQEPRSFHTERHRETPRDTERHTQTQTNTPSPRFRWLFAWLRKNGCYGNVATPPTKLSHTGFCAAPCVQDTNRLSFQSTLCYKEAIQSSLHTLASCSFAVLYSTSKQAKHKQASKPRQRAETEAESSHGDQGL